MSRSFRIGCPVAPAMLLAAVASAQPQLAVNVDLVDPGQAVTATIAAHAGQAVALVGSTVGAGFTYAGQPLSVGPDG